MGQSHAVSVTPPGVGDLCGEGVDEIQRIEDLLHEPGARIGRGAHTQASSFDLLDDVDGQRPAGQIAREALGALEVVRRDGLLAVHREPGVHPAQQRALELLREPLGAVQALEQAAVKDLLDEPRVEVRQLQELSLLCECAVGEEGVHVGVEVGGVRAERLDRDDQARCDVVAIEDRADARDDRVARGAGEQAEQAPLALEQPAQDTWNFSPQRGNSRWSVGRSPSAGLYPAEATDGAS